MHSFDAVEFARWVRDRWAVPAVACAVAVLLAFAFNIAQPKRYTATASVLIQPPGGSDPRAALAVSPVYLESLKSYERFASSDTLFLRAVQTLHIGEASTTSADSLKRQALKVTKPAGVALLEISATLKAPKEAQALAFYVAQQTVEMNRTLIALGSQDALTEYRTQLAAAGERLDAAQKAQTAFAAAQPVESLENEVQEAFDLRYRLERDLSSARADAPDEPTRISVIESQIRELTGRLAKQGSQLEERKARREMLEADQRAARGAWETAGNRINEALSSSQIRGERLQIIDPGTVPQHPSSPNMILNLLAAGIIALAGSFLYLALRFTTRRMMDVTADEFTRSLR